MSQAISPSTNTNYGLARVCRVWGVARSTVYWQRQERGGTASRPGPTGPCTDAELVVHIRTVLQASPFYGEGYRKVWARLRYAGVRPSPRRVLRLMREQGLLAPQRHGQPHGPPAHDGTILTDCQSPPVSAQRTSAILSNGSPAMLPTPSSAIVHNQPRVSPDHGHRSERRRLRSWAWLHLLSFASSPTVLAKGWRSWARKLWPVMTRVSA
jgi:hypothetical protein